MREAGCKLGQKANFLECLLNLILAVLLILIKMMVQYTFADYIVYLCALVERSKRVLEYHLAALYDLKVKLLGYFSVYLAALVEYFAGGGRVYPGYSAAYGGFAGTGFANQREGLSAVDLEVYVVYGNELFAARAERYLKVLDLYNGFPVGILVRMLQVGAEVLVHALRKPLYGFGLRHLGRAGVKIPGFCLMRGRNIKERGFLFEVYRQRLPVAGSKSIARYFVEQVRRGAVYRGQLFALYTKLRQCRKQRPCIGMPRIIEYFLSHAYFDYLACIHNRYPVRNVCNNAKVVRYVYYGHAQILLQLAYQVQYLCLNGNVKRGGGLVANKNVRMAGNSNGYNSPLPHTAGKLMRILIIAYLGIGDTDYVQHPYGFRLCGRLIQPLMQLYGFLYLHADLFERVKARHRVLHYHGYLLAADGAPFLLSGVLGKVVAFIHYAAAGYGTVLVKHAQEGFGENGLAGAGFANYGKRLALVKVK